MNSHKSLVVLAMAIVLSLAACAPTSSGQPTQTATPVPATSVPVKPTSTMPPSPISVLPTPAAPQAATDPQNATYIIDGKPVTLVNGKAEQEAAPGSAEKIVTQYFGNAVQVDLNGDGKLDSGFLLTQSGGGSGTFFYTAAAIQNPAGSYQGTNAILLGDRIAPQSTSVDPNNSAQFIVNYADHAPGQPMSAQPTQGVSKTFKLDNGTLVGVPPAS
jgi:hypothetical protein